MRLRFLPVLAPVAWIYGAAMAARNWLYDAGLRQAEVVPCPIICVGNLTAGGTGKTPAVIALAARLRDSGRKVAVCSRGYGRAGRAPLIVAKTGGPVVSWRQGGDEPWLMAHRLETVPVVVGADRVAAASLAWETFNPDVLLLDDGFQHRRLYRDVDLVVVDTEQRLESERLLPAGYRREPLRGLSRASAFLLTHGDAVGPARHADLRMHLARWAPHAILLVGRHAPRALRRYRGGRIAGEEPVAALRGRRVLAVSSIGKPEGFTRTLEACGAEIAATRSYGDHHLYTPADARALAAAGMEIVTTEKDAVRLAEVMPAEASWSALIVDLDITEGLEAWDSLVSSVIG